MHARSLTAVLVVALVAMLATPTLTRADDPDWSTMPYTLHSDYQAVDIDGFGTFPLTEPIKIQGIWLNDPDLMLDTSAAAPAYMGGQWQVYLQAATEDDFGGTALWMGQYVGKMSGNHPEGSYTDEEWLAEVDRVSHDPDTGYPFAPGDLVEIHARAPGLSYRGKTNVNEQHSINPALDFDIVLITEAAGLPRPAVLTLADLKDINDDFIFDSTRMTGAEHYQGSLIRINDVLFDDVTNWAPEAELTIVDGTGRSLPVQFGRGAGFTDYTAPTGAIDIIGIFDQEDTDDTDGYMDGYRLWVLDYDGCGCILPAPFALAGDTNCDGLINFDDINPFVTAIVSQSSYEADWPCCIFLNADCNSDTAVNFDDIDPFVELLIAG